MNIANFIEHTVLKADTNVNDIVIKCNEALDNQFFGVCVPPYFVKLAVQRLKNSNIKVVSVIGFPLGYCSTTTKLEDAKTTIDDGVDEIDMVINIVALKDKKYDYVSNDIQSIYKYASSRNVLLKVIIETALLTKDEKIKIFNICNGIKVDFVKTSTGFSNGGATITDIQLMRELLSEKIRIKASGGIKTNEQAIALINAGADKLGTSSSINLLSKI